jgi:2-oxoglutarate dehydrogenase E1 component
MGDGTRFVRYIPEPHANAGIELKPSDKIRKHILCTGQVYYALHRARSLNNITDVAISRIEQISPFPFDMLGEHLSVYPNAELIWCQEEPLNMGAWSYVQPRIDTVIKHLSKEGQLDGVNPIRYVGRAPSATVATGVKHSHVKEEVAFLSHALYGDVRKPKDFVNGIPLF